MPYIKSDDDRRGKLRNGEPALSAGELNYQIFYYVKHNWARHDFSGNIIRKFVEQFLGEKPNYQRYNDMAGCLFLCAKEIKRRLEIDLREQFKQIIDFYDFEIEKYEDKKCMENGDVE